MCWTVNLDVSEAQADPAPERLLQCHEPCGARSRVGLEWTRGTMGEGTHTEPAERPPLTEFGQHLLPSLYLVSWLGMSAPRIDCHVYALSGPGGLLLVDCGTPWGHERIRRNMAHWDLQPEDVRTILLT